MHITVGTYTGGIQGWQLVESLENAEKYEMKLRYSFAAHDGSIKGLVGGRSNCKYCIVTGGSDEMMRY